MNANRSTVNQLAVLNQIRLGALQIVQRVGRGSESEGSDDPDLQKCQEIWSQKATWYPSKYQEPNAHATMLGKVAESFQHITHFLSNQVDLSQLKNTSSAIHLLDTTHSEGAAEPKIIERGSTMEKGLKGALYRDLFHNHKYYDDHVGLRINLMRRYVDFMLDLKKMVESKDPARLQKIDDALHKFPPQSAGFYSLCPASLSDALDEAHAFLLSEPERLANDTFTDTVRPFIYGNFRKQITETWEERHLPFLVKVLMGIPEKEVNDSDQLALASISKLQTKDVLQAYLGTLNIGPKINQEIDKSIHTIFKDYLNIDRYEPDDNWYPDLLNNGPLEKLLATWKINRLDGLAEDGTLYHIDMENGTHNIVRAGGNETVSAYSKRMMVRIRELIDEKLNEAFFTENELERVDWAAAVEYKNPALMAMEEDVRPLQRFVGQILNGGQASEPVVSMALDLLYILFKPIVSDHWGYHEAFDKLEGMEVILSDQENFDHLACRVNHRNAHSMLMQLDSHYCFSGRMRRSAKNSSNFMPIKLALSRGHHKLVIETVKYYKNGKELLNSGLVWAFSNNNRDAVKEYVKHGATFVSNDVKLSNPLDEIILGYEKGSSASLLKIILDCYRTEESLVSQFQNFGLFSLAKACYLSAYRAISLILDSGIDLLSSDVDWGLVLYAALGNKSSHSGVKAILLIADQFKDDVAKSTFMHNALIQTIQFGKVADIIDLFKRMATSDNSAMVRKGYFSEVIKNCLDDDVAFKVIDAMVETVAPQQTKSHFTTALVEAAKFGRTGLVVPLIREKLADPLGRCPNNNSFLEVALQNHLTASALIDAVFLAIRDCSADERIRFAQEALHESMSMEKSAAQNGEMTFRNVCGEISSMCIIHGADPTSYLERSYNEKDYKSIARVAFMLNTDKRAAILNEYLLKAVFANQGDQNNFKYGDRTELVRVLINDGADPQNPLFLEAACTNDGSISLLQVAITTTKKARGFMAANQLADAALLCLLDRCDSLTQHGLQQRFKALQKKQPDLLRKDSNDSSGVDKLVALDRFFPVLKRIEQNNLNIPTQPLLQEALMSSVSQGKSESAIKALVMGADPYVEDAEARCFLRLVLQQDEKLAENLIRIGARVRSSAYQDLTQRALPVAVAERKEGMIRKLIQLGADPFENISEQNPFFVQLMDLSAAESKRMVQSALDSLDATSQSRLLFELLHAVVSSNRPILVAPLIELGADPYQHSADHANFIEHAVSRDGIDLLIAYIQQAHDVTSSHGRLNAVLRQACQYGKIPIVEALYVYAEAQTDMPALDPSIDYGPTNQSLIEIVASTANQQLIECLLRLHHSDTSVRGALYFYLCEFGQNKLANKLVDKDQFGVSFINAVWLGRQAASQKRDELNAFTRILEDCSSGIECLEGLQNFCATESFNAKSSLLYITKFINMAIERGNLVAAQTVADTFQGSDAEHIELAGKSAIQRARERGDEFYSALFPKRSRNSSESVG